MQVSIRTTLTAVALSLIACSSNSTVSPDGHGGAGGSRSTTAAGTGAESGTGAGPATRGVSFASFAAAGNRSTDGTHTAMSSLGPMSVTSGVSQSQKYRFVGGLVATTQP